MNFKMNRLVFVFVATALLAGACAPGQATPDAAEIADQIASAVAATVAAQQSATAAALALATATLPPTATSTFTPTPVLPTATPFVITPATSSSGGGGGGGGGGGSTTATYSCDPDTGKRPRDNSEFHPGDDFDIKWTIINTGTATWPAGTDFGYFSGPQMTTAGGLELPEMKPGDKYSVVFDGNAPDAKGFQVMTWKVQGGWCYPYVAIVVN